MTKAQELVDISIISASINSLFRDDHCLTRYNANSTTGGASIRLNSFQPKQFRFDRRLLVALQCAPSCTVVKYVLYAKEHKRKPLRSGVDRLSVGCSCLETSDEKTATGGYCDSALMVAPNGCTL